MTENECMDLIQKSVHENFLANGELIEGNLCRMAEKHYPSTMEGFISLCAAVLDYTINVSEITCFSIIKVLMQAGILDVRTPEKED